MPDQDFTLSVTRSRADFYDIMGIVSPKVWGWWRPLWNCGVLAVVSYVSAFTLGLLILRGIEGFDQNDIDQAHHAVIVAAIVAGFGVLILPLISNAVLKPKLVGPDGKFQSPSTITVNVRGISEQRESSSEQYEWQAFKGLKSGKRGYLFLTDVAEGIYIPYAAVGDRQERSQFESFVGRLISENR